MINQSRSMNKDLQQGLNDGMFKSLAPDRGGEVEYQEVYARYETLQPQYNIADMKKGLHPVGCGCSYC